MATHPLSPHPGCSAASAEARLREAEQQGDAASAAVLVKHLRQALQSSQLTTPAQLLLGIAGVAGEGEDCHECAAAKGHSSPRRRSCCWGSQVRQAQGGCLEGAAMCLLVQVMGAVLGGCLPAVFTVA